MTHKLIKTDNYLFVLEHSRIKRGDTVKYDNGYFTATHDNYHDSLMKIIAHLPLNGSPILEGVPLLPPYSRYQEDGLEDAVMSFKESWIKLGVTDFELSAFSVGYLQAREKYKYTEEDVVHLLHKTARKYFQEGREYKGNMAIAGDPLHGVRHELINIVQSLHQYPTEFECDMEVVGITDDGVNTIEEIKTITTAQGVQWVGKYK